MEKNKDLHLRIGVLASGRATSLGPLIEAIKNKAVAAEISLIITNKANAPVLEHQQKHGIETILIESSGKTRAQHEQIITQEFKARGIDLILLVGYMRILSAEFIAAWPGRVINVHPSLLPAFSGLMDLDLHRAVLAAHAKTTGCTVHLVTAKVDAGPIILQKCCAVEFGDTPEALKAKVQALEGEALVEAVQNFIGDFI